MNFGGAASLPQLASSSTESNFSLTTQMCRVRQRSSESLRSIVALKFKKLIENAKFSYQTRTEDAVCV